MNSSSHEQRGITSIPTKQKFAKTTLDYINALKRPVIGASFVLYFRKQIAADLNSRSEGHGGSWPRASRAFV